MSKDIQGVVVTLRRFLENDEVIELILELLHMASEVEEVSVKGLLKRAILGLMLNEG